MDARTVAGLLGRWAFLVRRDNCGRNLLSSSASSASSSTSNKDEKVSAVASTPKLLAKASIVLSKKPSSLGVCTE